MEPPREPTHTLTFADFAEAMDALALLIQHGYRQSLERLVLKSARIVPGRAFGLPRGAVRRGVDGLSVILRGVLNEAEAAACCLDEPRPR